MDALRHLPTPTRHSARRALHQPAPRLARTALPPSGYDQPLDERPLVRERESSLVHLLDLRRRYRDEAKQMRDRVTVMQAALEECSREVWHHLATGYGAPANLRNRCDDLVAELEAAERDLADVHLAIEGIGHEVTGLLAVRSRG